MFILPHLKGLTAGNIGSAAFKSASLDLKFADNKSLTDAITGSNLVTFTRASSGTFVGSDGVLQTAVTNLLTNSEAANTGFLTVRASISADVGISPVGTSTADKIVEDSTASSSHYLYRYPTIVAGATYTYSVYLKADSRTFALIGFGDNIESNGARVGVNLTTGMVGTPFAFGTGTAVSASSVNVGIGWYRVILTGIADSSSTSGLCTVYLANSLVTSGVPSYSGDNTSGVLIWGAQLEQSTTVGEYIPTTSTINSAPRFDHNPTTGESLGLLVEEQRTNLMLQSEDFSTTWINVNSSEVVNAIQAPNGTATADEIVVDGANGTHSVRSNAITSGSGTIYTFSCYVKAGTSAFAFVGLTDLATGGAERRINLSTGVIDTTNVGGTGSWTSISATVSNVGDGWYRVSVTGTQGGGTSVAGQVLVGSQAGARSYTGNSTDSVYAWGAQLEAGAFPTSYIPTTTAAVTRNADVASITGSAYSSWFTSANENTFYVEGIKTQVNVSNGTFLCGSNNTVNAIAGGWITYNSTGAKPRFQSRHGSVRGDTQNNTADLSAGSLFKGALCTSTDTFAAVSNGSLVASAATPPQVDWGTSLAIGWFPNGGYIGALNGHIRRLTFWPQRLTNSTLQTLTQ